MKSLLLLHGALGAKSEFDRLIPVINDTFDVHTLDFEGHGNRQTDREFSMDHFTENLVDYIKSSGLERPQVFGYSMGGYVALNTTIKHPELLGDIITLGTKLGWSPEIAEGEVRKINPEKIEEKVPHFANYLNGLHLNWVENMYMTADLMNGLGNGKALTAEDFSNVTNTVHMRLGDQDNMVSEDETRVVADAIPNANFEIVKDTPHPLPQISTEVIASLIKSLLA